MSSASHGHGCVTMCAMLHYSPSAAAAGNNYAPRRSLDLREEYPRNGNGGGLPDSSRHLRVPELRPEIPSIREEEAALRRSQEEGLMVRRPLALDSSGEPAVTDSLASWPSAPNLHTSVSPKPQDMDVSVKSRCVGGLGALPCRA